MDKRFRIQVILSLIVISFCIISIFAGKTEAAYWSTLSGILGYWLPTPTDSLPSSRGKKNDQPTQ